jgi:hypothetical protein
MITCIFGLFNIVLGFEVSKIFPIVVCHDTYVVVAGSILFHPPQLFTACAEANGCSWFFAKYPRRCFIFISPLTPKVHLYNEFWAKLLYCDFVVVCLRGISNS